MRVKIPHLSLRGAQRRGNLVPPTTEILSIPFIQVKTRPLPPLILSLSKDGCQWFDKLTTSGGRRTLKRPYCNSNKSPPAGTGPG